MTDDAFKKAYVKAVRYLAKRARSRMEMVRYLSSKQVAPDVTDRVVSRLTLEKYLDDRAFAEAFIESRIRFKPKSTYALKFELTGKGIDEHLADELLGELSDLDLALKATAPRQAQWAQLEPDTCKKKLMNYLRYRGFDYGICLRVWERLFR